MRHPILNTVLHLIRKTLWHKGKKETVQGHVWMWELDYKECWAPKNWCFWTVMLEKTLESSLDCKEIQPVLKEISPDYSLQGLMWRWNYNTLATWCEKLTHLQRPWCWERLKVGEGDDSGWDGWMAFLTWWTGVWVSSGS